MISNINKVILIGNLGVDPEIKSLQSGDQIAHLRIATSDTWKDKKTGEHKERTQWHQVVIFNKSLVKLADQYLKKGSKIYIEGQLQNRKWQDQNGNTRYTTEIVLGYNSQLHILNYTKQKNSETHYGKRDDSSHNQNKNAFISKFARKIDDEIPF
ncbi:MAG: single-strand DNA-binding protein [Candidatus Tokpelaia sp. JSC161]|jgi:single-strand DNA-binding protein|nr:MAG: single-strand DNA-binding protein [Candidatus Tokpelaia sp. JSC161]